MPGCPACGRPVAVARATCLYCGVSLPSELVPTASATAAPALPTDAPAETARPERSLLVLDLDGVEASVFADLTGQALCDAAQLVRRGGLRLHRVLERGAAEALAARFRDAAVTTYVVPEGEARQRPLCARRGERAGAQLLLRTAEALLTLRAEELLLVVTGPIAREPAPRLERRRFDTARLPESWCAHLHRLADPRPIELDPRRIELGFAVTGSAQLEIEAWIGELGRDLPRDDSFRRETPALAPPPPEDDDPLGAWSLARSPVRRGSADTPPPAYDNLAQFRFYSGWRAAVERRRPGSRLVRGAC